MHVDDRIGLVRVETRDSIELRLAQQIADLSRRHRENDGVVFFHLALRQAERYRRVAIRQAQGDEGDRRCGVDGVEASRRGLREMRQRHRRKTETRRRGVAQEGRLQHEQRVVRTHFIERGVECGDEERIPERAPFPRTLFVLPQPVLECECPSTPLAIARSAQDDKIGARRAQDDKTNVQLFPRCEVRIGGEGRQQMKRRR